MSDTRPLWMDDRACRLSDPSKFDASTGERPQTPHAVAAKRVCEGCPVKVECLLFGMNEDFGVYGGTVPLERKAMREERSGAATA